MDKIFCSLCHREIENPTNKTQKYHLDCRKIVKKLNDQKYGQLYKVVEPEDRSDLINKRIYDFDAYFKVIGGPEEIQDFIDFGSYFTNQEITRGICDGWIPSGTVLKKKDTTYIIEGKKRLIFVGGKHAQNDR